MADDKQIERERVQIEQAPKVEAAAVVGRCSFCGRVARQLTPVEVVHGLARSKGECCAR